MARDICLAPFYVLIQKSLVPRMALWKMRRFLRTAASEKRTFSLEAILNKLKSSRGPLIARQMISLLLPPGAAAKASLALQFVQSAIALQHPQMLASIKKNI